MYTLAKNQAKALCLVKSKDKHRPHINSVLFSPKRGCAVATDGHRLLILNVPTDMFVDDFLVDGAWFEDATKRLLAKDVLTIAPDVCPLVDLHYPEFQRVVPDYVAGREIVHEVGFSAKYMADAAKIGEWLSPDGRMTVQLGGSDSAAILLGCDGVFHYVLMPMRARNK